MIIDRPVAPGQAARPDPALVKLIARAHLFQDKLLHDDGKILADVSRREKVTGSYFTRVMRLAYLAPDIATAVLDGRQPRDLTAQRLLKHSRLPLSRSEQRRVFGFA